MRKPLWLLMAAVPTVFGLGVAAFVVLRAQHSLERASADVAHEGIYPMELRKVARQENPGFESIASSATYTSGVFFHGKLFVSGPSGLSIFGSSDLSRPTETRLLKSYRVGLDLPTAPLGQVVVGRLRGASEPELMIATSGEGVLVFSSNGNADGSGVFRQIRPIDKEARDITALLPLPTGELLIGTRKRGLLVYRGLSEDRALESFHAQTAPLAITALAMDATGVWIGTHDHGVQHWHGGQLDSFDVHGAVGLPDAQVDAIAVHGDKVYVGTPLGVEEFVDGRPSRRLANNLFANALYADDAALTVGSMEEGIVRVSLDVSRSPGRFSRGRDELVRSETIQAKAFLRAETAEESGTAIYAVTEDGVSRQQESGRWTPLLGQNLGATSPSAALTDGNISALAFDPDGRLWVGYFDRGLDVLSARAEREAHFEDDRLFCVNRIVLDSRRNRMAVGTANGLVLMDPSADVHQPGQVTKQVMTKHDGLIADHVTDVAFHGETMVVATPAGLTFVDGSGVRSLYAFEGLVNNHVYSLGVSETRAGIDGAKDNAILAGTLGGVSELRHEEVQRNLTVGNSGLKHNWVTSIVAEGEPDTWFVGTYGAGVMRLDKDGRFTPMEGATRAMEVNPNAMLATRTHIFAGTLGDGLWVWSRERGRWCQVTAGLPSENVTAIAEHGGEVYVGTENGLVRIAEGLLD